MDSNALSMLKYIMETPAQVRSNIKNAESLTAKMVSLCGQALQERLVGGLWLQL